jgi:nucleoside 2-deoxyribosyltransferase
MSKKYDCYLASPLFSETDNAQLDVIELLLDKLGITYFSPRKDSNGVGDLRGAKSREEKDKIAQAIYDLNVNAIEDSKFLLVNTKGVRWDNATYQDAGTIWELGYAMAKDIPVMTFNFENFPINIMFSQKVVQHFKNIGEPSDLLLMERSLDTMLDDLRKELPLPSELRKKYFTLIDELV